MRLGVLAGLVSSKKKRETDRGEEGRTSWICPLDSSQLEVNDERGKEKREEKSQTEQRKERS